MAVAMKESRVKMVMAMDPWFLPFAKEYEKIRMDKPCLVIQSESFNSICKHDNEGMLNSFLG